MDVHASDQLGDGCYQQNCDLFKPKLVPGKRWGTKKSSLIITSLKNGPVFQQSRNDDEEKSCKKG